MGGKPTAMKKIIVVLFAFAVLTIAFYHKADSRFVIDAANSPEVIAVEKMIDKTGANVPPVTKKRVALAIAEHARYYGIKPKSLVAIAYVESSFKPTLINSTGDHGLMQINWPTWKNRFTKNPNDLLNVYKNVEVACKIININKSMGHTDLAAYHSFNSVPKAIYEAKLKNVLRRL
jgi:soluble lytic murein transglycosylase-like protein